MADDQAEHDNEENIPRRYSRSDQVTFIETFSVEKVINQDVVARTMFEYYKQATPPQFLNKKRDRKMIYTLVGNAALQVKPTLEPDDLEPLSKKIVETFPGEDVSTYFSKKDGKPCGTLYNYYRNKKAKARVFTKAMEQSDDEQPVDRRILEHKEFLDTNVCEDWNQVKYAWGKTRNMRKKDLHAMVPPRKKAKKAPEPAPAAVPVPAQTPAVVPVPAQTPAAVPVPAQTPAAVPVPAQTPAAVPVPAQAQAPEPLPTDLFVENWPSLKTNLGYQLIELDFEAWYPQAKKLTQKKLDNLVYQLSVRRDPFKNDKTLKWKAEITELNRVIDTHDNVNIKNICKIKLLAYLLPSLGRADRYNHTTVVDIHDSMMLHVMTAAEVDNKLVERSTKLKRIKKQLQPVLVVIGNDLTHIEEFICCFNEIRWKLPDLISSFDILFKCFFTMLVNYPYESETIYGVIQKYIYNIDGNITPQAAACVTDLRALRNPEVEENDV